MRESIKEILGKTITGIVVAESPRTPEMQVFMLFSDDTYFELFGVGNGFTCAGGVDPGGIDKVHSYLSKFNQAEIKMEFIRQGS